MALGNRQDRAPEHLGGVGAETQAKGDGARSEGGKLEALDAKQISQATHQADRAEIDQQHPEQFGHAAHDGGIAAAEPL